jgi:putative chitinase
MSANIANYLGVLLLGGLLGVIGQGVRAIVGLKKMFDQAETQNVGQYDLFLASRLLISLFIGFIAGAAAAFFSAIKPGGPIDLSTSTLTAFAAAGYAGTDFIEGLASRFTTNTGPTPPGQGAEARPGARA